MGEDAEVRTLPTRRPGEARTLSMRTPVGRARGLGSAKHGAHHWWMLRLTSLALIPLTVWLVASIVALAGASHREMLAWVGEPAVAVLLLLFVGIAVHHAVNGMQVVYEDYVGGRMARLALDIATKFAGLILAVTTGFAILRIAFTG